IIVSRPSVRLLTLYPSSQSLDPDSTVFLIEIPSSSPNVGNLGSYPGSLDRATGEIVTESEVSRVFRGTDNWQSDLGSWGPSTAREGRLKGNISLLTSEVIEGRVAINGA